MKTRDRIAHAALELFNENGERAITTNHIAAHIEISPGNLYYHFSNKQEIIREIFKWYQADLVEYFSPMQGEQQDAMTLSRHYLTSMFNLVWKYRFFYANLPEILNRDDELHLSYSEAQTHLKSNLATIVYLFIELKLFRPMTDTEIQRFVTSLHMTCAGWLAYQSASQVNTQVTEQMVFQGMIQLLHLVKAWASPEGYEQLLLLEEGVEAMYAL